MSDLPPPLEYPSDDEAIALPLPSSSVEIHVSIIPDSVPPKKKEVKRRIKALYKRTHVIFGEKYIVAVKEVAAADSSSAALYQLNAFRPDTCATISYTSTEVETARLRACAADKDRFSDWIDHVVASTLSSTGDSFSPDGGGVVTTASDSSTHADVAIVEGNKSVAAGLLGKALKHFNRALELRGSLEDRMRIVDVLIAKGDEVGAISHCVKTIKIIRAQQENAIEPDAAALKLAVAKVYGTLGTLYLRQDRLPRAINAFTLSVKEVDTDEIRDQLDACLKLQSTSASTGLVDIEDILRNTVMMKQSDPFSFACTGCGECCRTADYIQLSPVDIFNMTRSANASIRGVSLTTDLRLKMPTAIHFTLRNGLPLAFLRPVKSGLGQCHFAYPLYKDSVTGVMLSYEELVKEKLIHVDGDSDRPLDANEYNLTEEEEARVVSHGTDSSESAGEGEVAGVSEEDDEVSVGSPGIVGDSFAPRDVTKIMNSYGSQGLGCMFGRDGMPNVCATYPVARETAFVDFFHNYNKDERACASEESLASLQECERVVVINAPRCEGFDWTAGAASHESTSLAKSWGSTAPLPDEGLSPKGACETKDGGCCGGAECVSDAKASPLPETTDTVASFLSTRDIPERWSYQDQFMELLAEVEKSGVMAKLEGSGPVKDYFVQTISRIWYHFDSLKRHASSMSSWGLTWKIIKQLTMKLISATLKFVGSYQDYRVLVLQII